MGLTAATVIKDGLFRFAPLVAGVLLCFGVVSPAEAAPGCKPGESPCPPLLSEVGGYGDAAGQIGGRGPDAIATSPTTGHFYVAEETRIDEFDAKGHFVKAWGWGVRDGAPEPQVCTTATGCIEGLYGSRPGEFRDPKGIAVDASGNVWVFDFSNRRLQKFTPAGVFVLMVGGEVNKTAVQKREQQEANAEPVTVTEAEENLCTAASGDLCGSGVDGTGAGEISLPGIRNPLAVGPGGTIYVGDVNRVQKFNEAGVFQGAIALPGAGKTQSLTVTLDGRLYVLSEDIKEPVGGLGTGISVSSMVVREIGPSGEELGRLVGEWEGKKTPKDPLAVAADAGGNVYVSAQVVYPVPGKAGEFQEFPEVVAFDSAGNLISFESDRAGFDRPSDPTRLISLATNVVEGTNDPGEVFVGHFVNGGILGPGKQSISYVRSFGAPFEVAEGAPEITGQFAVSATDTDAAVEGLINPRFTTDTTFQVEYGTGKCTEGGCTSVAPILPVALPGAGGNTAVKSGPVTLSGLAPGTEYHFRFAAENKVTDEEASGPVLGAEGTFRTFAALKPPDCPNDQVRIEGSGTLLPDCRGYEMVSPVDKEGGEIWVQGSVPGYPAEINQSTPAGSTLTYSSYRAFADPDAAPYTSQYLAERSGSGWSSEPISPLREGTIVPGLDTQYRAFSEDLSRGWLVTDSEPVLAPGGVPGYRNLYRRDNTTGTYQAQCSAPSLEPSSDPPYRLEPQGMSADGSHLVFGAEARLTAGAAPGKVPQVYECVNGTELRLVSVLPGGEAATTGAVAGNALGDLGGYGMRINAVTGAVSDDGNRIFWTAAPIVAETGPLYVRIGGTKTVQIAAANARFRMASPNGDRVIYTVGKTLFESAVGTDSASSTQVAAQVDGVMGASEDTQLIYLLSREDLDGGGPAAAGKPNLYLYRAQSDTFTFIGELSDDDAREKPASEETDPVLTPVALAPYNRSSRITPDGLHAAFTSTARLTGYDNTDQVSGEPDAEVFVYDAESGELVCASCNPSGALPRGSNVGVPAVPFWAAAHIPGWENQHHASRALSEDGSRLFFEAADALALEDTNGVQDVYQWQLPGTGSCTEASASYSSFNGGCVDLISSGKSKQPSELVDASADGSDVFFKTTESLWPGDPGLADIYDARAGGGFPAPSAPTPPCEAGVNCQERGAPPVDTPPVTDAVGSGNPPQPKPKPVKCKKGFHKVKKNGKVRCVKNKSKGKASKNRGAGR